MSRLDELNAHYDAMPPVAAMRIRATAYDGDCLRLHAPLAVGSTRSVHNADGTVLSERVTVLDPPVRHAYVLSGFRPPFSWLVTQGEANWTFAGHEFGSRVRWDYEFELTRRWLWPVAALVLKLFMARAMHRCLKNMARALMTPDPAPGRP